MNKDVAEISQTYQVEAAEQGVPVGYKQTEVGVIPEDWQLITIEKALSDNYLIDQMDGNHGGLYPKSHEFALDGVPYVGATDFRTGRIDYKSCKYLSQTRAEMFKKGIAKNGDVLFAHNATVGPVALVETDLDFIVLSTTATYYRCNPKKLNNIYLAKYFESDFFKKQYMSVMSQSTRNQVPVFTQRKFFIIIPSEKEQVTIANALSDVDALLGELEKLIAKKQAIKTATMQQLLTGRTRLPQFAQHQDGSPKGYKQSELGEIPEDWDSINLGVCAEVCMCKRIFSNQTLDVGFIPFYKIGTFGKEADAYISKEIYAEYRAKYSFPKKGDVLISAAGTLGRTVIYDGEPAYFQDSNIVWLDINKSKLSNIYLYHYYQVIKWASTEGSTIARLYNGIIKASLITLPSIEEQTAIATILSDMDAELQALEQRLNKTRQIKQGMMQQLLTGKIRLAKPTHKESEYD